MSRPKGRAMPCPNCGLWSMFGQTACARLMDYCTTVPVPADVEPERADCGCLVIVPATHENEDPV